MGLIFYSDRLPPAVFMSFELVLPAALVSAFYIDPFCSESSLLAPHGLESVPLQ